ncbi:MAG TPA: hypothetical protein VE567_01140, partial [Sphingomonas sp.]|nr:hypothetical protein [Sphingomonas sp.]
GGPLLPRLVPSQRRARVAIADGTLRAFGFSKGGQFQLIAPDISFGSDAPRDGATHIGLDFAVRQGFGSLDLTSNRTRFVSGLFDNGRANVSAFRETTSFRVRAGETLSLSQTLLPLVTSRADVTALLTLPTGGALLDRLTPAIPGFAIDRRAIDLRIGGLGELVVDAGAAIIGEAGATITAPKIINSGRIVLPGGTLRQEAAAPSADAATNGLGVRSLAALLGAERGNSETAPNALGLTQNGRVLTNAELFTRDGADRLVFLLGEGDETDGIRLRAGSVTDLSGTAIFDPRARFLQDPQTGQLRQERIGTLIGGGTIATASTLNDEGAAPLNLFSRTLVAEAGATIDISGARATFDEFVPGKGFVASDQWSAGGRIAALGGGTIAGARINAYGGYGEDGGAFLATGQIVAGAIEGRAQGGTLEWARPTVAAALPANAENVLLDSAIEASGFDTLIARNGLRFDGAVDLTLGKALFVTAPVTRGGVLPVNTSYQISATAGTRARVNAPYIAFVSRAGSSALGEGFADQVQGEKAEVQFEAGAQGIDLVGATLFGASIGKLEFRTDADIRFIGVDTRTDLQRQTAAGQGSLNGQIASFADMTFAAARTYATTGTGNLQAFVDAERTTGKAPVSTAVATYAPYTVLALGNSTIRFEQTVSNLEAPLSAGSYVRVLATRIEQDGYLAAPLGRLELGTAQAPAGIPTNISFTPTESVTFGAGSVTSVAGGTTSVPY